MWNKSLVVYIEEIVRFSSDNVLFIKGWCADMYTKSIPEIIIEHDPNIIFVQKKNIFRGDVNSAYNISMELSCGFKILVKTKNIYEGKIYIRFFFDKQEKKVVLDLKKKYCHLCEVGNPLQVPFLMYQKGLKYIKNYGINKTFRHIKNRIVNKNTLYNKWIKKCETKLWDTNEEILSEIDKFVYKPKISIIVPVYDVDEKWLRNCLNSVENQYYPNWELCIADDHSSDPQIRSILDEYVNNDPRIKVIYRNKNGHISEASNTALSLATGEYIGLLDNDDELSDKALYEVVKLINEKKLVDLVYSDEDKIDKKGHRSDPYFKSDWAPDSIMSGNYICHFSVLSKKIIDEVGGFRKGFEGAQDYDLILRVTEKTSHIYHIPKILYHWRTLKTSTAKVAGSKNYAFIAGKKALESALERRKLEGVVREGAFPGIYNVDYNITEKKMVSIIIPTRDNVEDLKKCVDSIIVKTSYQLFEIIIADNGSVNQETLVFFKQYSIKYPNIFKVIRIDIPFNYAKINNIAEKSAKGDFLLFLNNDTEVISDNWLTKLVSYAQLDHIGAVGAKLYYPDDTVQHAGVVVGIGGSAGHIHYHFPRCDNGYFGKLVSNTNFLAVTGACLMVKKTIFDNINGFDENFEVAFNDVDLCIRIYEKGYFNVWLHDVELYHFESKSRGYEDNAEKKKRFTKEINLLRNKWLKYIVSDPFYNINLTKKRSDFSLELESDYQLTNILKTNANK